MQPSRFDDRRLSVYLSGLAQVEPASADRPEDPYTVICGASESRGHIFRRYAFRYSWAEFRGARYKNYIREAQTLFRRVDPQAVLAVFPEDSRDRFSAPTIVRSRLIEDRDTPSVLFPLDWQRHWGEVARIAREDIDFAAKTDTLVWRGATTGVFQRNRPGSHYSSRFHLASLEIDRPDIDIGFSDIVQIDDQTSDVPLSAIRERLRPPLSIRDQLRARFLLSLEGNDVATGLKWMLASNSAVVMPRPTCESWACEGELVPFEHYIPVRDDLSDLEAVLDWGRSHPAEAERIARNGKRFIESFLDPEREIRLAREVASAYLAKARFTLDFGPIEQLTQRLASLPGLRRRHGGLGG